LNAETNPENTPSSYQWALAEQRLLTETQSAACVSSFGTRSRPPPAIMLGKKADEKTEGLNLPFDDEKLVEISVNKNEQKAALYLGNCRIRSKNKQSRL